jgi:hypothetical protein
MKSTVSLFRAAWKVHPELRGNYILLDGGGRLRGWAIFKGREGT